MSLTSPQAAALAAIRRLSTGGIAPSYAELQAELGYASRSSVCRVLYCLRERGLVAFSPGRARTLRIVEQDPYGREQLAELSSADLRRLRVDARTIINERQRMAEGSA